MARAKGRKLDCAIGAWCAVWSGLEPNDIAATATETEPPTITTTTRTDQERTINYRRFQFRNVAGRQHQLNVPRVEERMKQKQSMACSSKTNYRHSTRNRLYFKSLLLLLVIITIFTDLCNILNNKKYTDFIPTKPKSLHTLSKRPTQNFTLPLLSCY